MAKKGRCWMSGSLGEQCEKRKRGREQREGHTVMGDLLRLCEKAI